MGVRRLQREELPTEPTLASVYKVLKFIDAEMNGAQNLDQRWSVLGSIRYMLGQRPYQMDDVRYSDMRDFIDEFGDRWGLW